MLIRNRDKKGALTGASAAVLLGRNILICGFQTKFNISVRVTLSCVSRVLIFSSWMFVTFDGNFHPIATISGFYLTVLIMIIFNIVFNKSADILTFKYWIGKPELLFDRNIISNQCLRRCDELVLLCSEL